MSKDTAWRWRHRLLAAHLQYPDPPFRDVVEILERPYPENRKGCRDLERPARVRGSPRWRWHMKLEWAVFLRDSDAGTFAATTGSARPNAYAVDLLVGARLRSAQELVGRGGPLALPARLAAVCRLAFRRLRGSDLEARRTGHQGSVHGYERRLRLWLRRFRGVATRYLTRYFRWYQVLDLGGMVPRQFLAECVAAQFGQRMPQPGGRAR